MWRLYNFVTRKQSVESVYRSQSQPTIYPLAFEKSTLGLPFISSPLSARKIILSVALSRRMKEKNGQDYATNEPSDHCQERINYCPLTVSFPAPELSVSPPFREGSTAIFNFMHPLYTNGFSITIFHHASTNGQLLSFDCPSKFGMRIAGKTTVELSKLIAKILTSMDAFNSSIKFWKIMTSTRTDARIITLA